jgi:hypothetical protein
MKTISRFCVFVLLPVSFAFSTHAQSSVRADEGVSAIHGRIEKDTYINDVFGFKLTIPKEGVVLDRAQTDVFRSAGADFLKGDNKALGRKIDNEIGKETTLLHYLSKPLGSVENSSFVIGVVKEPAAATANIVLAETLKELTASGKYKLVESLRNIKVGGVNFVGIVGTMTVGNSVINIKFLVTMRKGFAMVINSSYFDENSQKRSTISSVPSNSEQNESY